MKKMYEKVLEEIKNINYDSFGIRRTCADEDYKVGDIARNSFYWDVENDLSSYQTEPEEMSGASARAILVDDMDSDEENLEVIKKTIEKFKKEYPCCLPEEKFVILGSDCVEYDTNDGDIIMEDAEVLYIF